MNNTNLNNDLENVDREDFVEASEDKLDKKYDNRFADIKADLDNKIKNNFFANQGQSDVFATGKKHHQEVLEYIKEKVLEDEDIDF